jgi:predicted ATPase/DNA-binding SARP family transcriptional activator/Tfp pilus assembly protein PilF
VVLLEEGATSGRRAGLSLRLFGPFDVRLDGKPLPSFRTRKGQWLLALLALRGGKAVDRSWLAATLWPDAEESRALFYLRRELSDVRRALGSQAQRIQSPSPQMLVLDLDGVDVDVLTFDEGIRDGGEEQLAAAVRTYTGPLLEGCTEEWIEPERRARDEEFLNAATRAAELAIIRGDFDGAAMIARQAVAADPLRESAQRLLIRALAESGDLAAAALQYRKLRLLLKKQLGVEPEAQTREEFARIRQRLLEREGETEAPSPSINGKFPHALTELIGREEDVVQVLEMLANTRLLTLTGSGGIGKTSLAMRIAAESASRFRDGAWFVECAPLRDPEDVPRAAADVLGVPPGPSSDPIEGVIAAIRSKRLLLILDNLEQLLPGCTSTIESILKSCPDVRILATSRTSLGITGGMTWRVPSLGTPALDERAKPEKDLASRMMEFPAVQLFVERARQADSGFKLTAPYAAAVATICDRLDGIPLAIELAAARATVLSASEIAARIDDRFRLLVGIDPVQPSRHRTLAAAVQWSYDLLDEPQRTLFERLSVFSSRWTLEAAEAVCSGKGLDESEVFEILAQLIDRSLVIRDETPHGPEFRMLETLREYGRHQLFEHGDGERTAARHFDYFLSFAEGARDLIESAQAAEGMRAISSQIENVRAAASWSLGEPDWENALRLGITMTRYWSTSGQVREADAFYAAALARCPADDRSLARARAIGSWAIMRDYMGDLPGAKARHEESIALFREQGEDQFLANSLHNLAVVIMQQGDYDASTELLEEALSINRRLKNARGEANNLTTLGNLAGRSGDELSAKAYYEGALRTHRETGNKISEAITLRNLADVLRSLGDEAQARAMYGEAIALFRETGNNIDLAEAYGSLGRLAQDKGDFDAARSFFRESLEQYEEMRYAVGAVGIIEYFAGLEWIRSDLSRAVTLCGAANAIRKELGAPVSPANAKEIESIMATAREAMDEADVTDAWSCGARMSRDEAVAFALSTPSDE